MLSTALLLTTSLQALAPAPPQTPAATPPPAGAERAAPREEGKASPPASPQDATEQAVKAAKLAAEAIERAVKAAEQTAEASARLAAAAERLAAATHPEGAPAKPDAPVAAAPAKPEEKKDEWKGSVGLGLIALWGNTSTITFNGLGSAERKTEDWIYALKAYGTYGRSRPPEGVDGVLPEAQVVAMAAGLELRGDRRFTQVLSGYLLGGAETDHVKSVELRGYGEAGAGIIWWDVTRPDKGGSSLRTDLAFRFVRETRFQYYPLKLDLPDVDLGGPRVGLSFRYALNEHTVFTETAEVVPDLLGSSRVLASSETKVSTRLTETLALATSFVIKHDSQPAPGKLPTDAALSATLEVGF
jgi:hypothetical protein